MITAPLDGLSINIPDTGKPRVVIIGAGFGGLNTAEKLSSKDFQIVLLDKRNYHTFQPLLYQVATAGLQTDSIAAPLRNAFNHKKDFHFRMLRALSVNSDTNTISTIAGDLKYDYLVIANGMKTNFFGNEQIEKYALPLKSVPDALNLRSQIMQIMELANMTTDPLVREKIMTIVIAGAGPTGVEIAGALSELRKHVLPKDYPGLDFSEMKIYIIEGAGRILPPMSLKSSERAQRYLEKMGIILKPKALVESYDGQNVTLKGGEKIPTYTVIWSAGVKGDVMQGLKPEWAERGRLLTDEYCKVKGSNNIFVMTNWIWNYFTYDKGNRLIIRPYIRKGDVITKQMFVLNETE